MALHFEYPHAFWGLLPVAALAWLMLYNRSKHPRSFCFRRFTLVLAAFTLCVLGLSRPQLGRNSTEAHSVKSNVFLAMDISRSMLATDIMPSRLSFSIAFAQRLLTQLEGAKVAVYPFAFDGFLQIPLTSDMPAVSDLIASLNPNIVSNQGTDLSGMLATLFKSIARMERTTKANGGDWFPTQVVLISDGESHLPLRDDVTRLYRQAHIPIFTVGVGTPSGSTIPIEGRYADFRDNMRDKKGTVVRTTLDPKTLHRLSSDTGGDYFSAQFDEVNRLAIRLRQSMRIGRLATSFKVDKEYFPFCFALAFLFFFLEFSFGRWQYAIRAWLIVSILGLATGTARLYAAEEDSAEVVAEKPMDSETRAILAYDEGLKQLKQSSLLKAAELFQEAAMLTQDNEVKKKALFNLGNTLLKKMDPAQALEAYQQGFDVVTSNKKFNQESNRRFSENMALANRVLEQMKKMPKQGEGQGQGDDEDGKKGKAPEDKKGPQKFQAERLSETQRQKIFDLVSSEEQQSLQRIQEQRNRPGKSRPNDKPW